MLDREVEGRPKEHPERYAGRDTRKPYRTPQMVVYGDVASLTAGGTSGIPDHGNNMMLA